MIWFGLLTEHPELLTLQKEQGSKRHRLNAPPRSVLISLLLHNACEPLQTCLLMSVHLDDESDHGRSFDKGHGKKNCTKSGGVWVERVRLVNSRQYKARGKDEHNTGHSSSNKCGSHNCSCLILINQGMHFPNERSQ